MKSNFEKLEAELEELLSTWGYELVLIRYRSRGRRGHLQLLIDKPGGVTLDDCQQVSEQIGGYLDVADPIPGRYILEVSSPGVDRPLTKERHFQANLGKRVSLRLSEKFCGQRKIVGTLSGFNEESITIRTETETISVPREIVEDAKILFQWD